MTTGTEVAVRQGQAAAIPAKLAYARALADSGLLPSAYRRQPANVLWAVEYGEMLGLPPMAAMTGVHVIEGKPTASAGLISGLVRQAGHKLRVWGTNKSATCEIVRSDDPEHTFSVTWTLKRNSDDNPSAEEAGLLGKNVWKNYPASMLKSRAITQCARDACEEVLYGLHYTPEELGAEVDGDGEVVDDTKPAPVRIEYGPGGSLVVDPDCLVDPSPEQEWLAAALEAAPGHASLDACGVAWARVVEYVNDGKLTKDKGARLQDALRVRIAELKAAAEAEAQAVPAEVVLDPDDPWAAKVEELSSEDEAAAALEELEGLVGAGTIDAEHFARVGAAIEAKFPKAAGQSQVAA